MERQHGGVQGEAGQDEVFRPGGVGGKDALEGKAPRLVVIEHHPGEEQKPAEHVEQQVAEARLDGLFLLPVPDEEHGRKGHDLPKDEEREVIAGEDGPQGAPHIKEAGHVVPVFVPVQGIECAQKRHDDKHPGKDHAQRVHATEQSLHAEETVPAVRPVPGKRDGQEGNGGNQENKRLLRLPLQEGQEQGPQEKEQRRVNPSIHSNPRPCSETGARCPC